MTSNEIIAKTILSRHKRVDSWFASRYGMNLYRGCTHNCAYCDGRAEGYYVTGNFGYEVAVKINAIEILEKEVTKLRKKEEKPGFILVGGGVCDGYQPIEKKYELSRKALLLIHDAGLPVHMLTKSTLIGRDLDILKEINRQTRAMVSMSFSSADDSISRIMEPGVPLPSERFKLLKLFKDEGIPTGMFLMPVIPFLTDTPQQIENTLQKAKEAGVDFVIFSGMTLKDGRQRDHFMKILGENFPGLVEKYSGIYHHHPYGAASPEYYEYTHKVFYPLARKYEIPVRIPSRLFKDWLNQNDLIVIILEQMDYVLKLLGEKSPYGYGAYSISQLQVPVSEMKDKLTTLKGIGKVTEKFILEILENGTCKYYEKLMSGK